MRKEFHEFGGDGDAIPCLENYEMAWGDPHISIVIAHWQRMRGWVGALSRTTYGHMARKREWAARPRSGALM